MGAQWNRTGNKTVKQNREQHRMIRFFQFSLLALMGTALASLLLFVATHAWENLLEARARAARSMSTTNNFRNLSHACYNYGSCPICREIANR